MLARRARRFRKACVSGRLCRDSAPSSTCSPLMVATCRQWKYVPEQLELSSQLPLGWCWLARGFLRDLALQGNSNEAMPYQQGNSTYSRCSPCSLGSQQAHPEAYFSGMVRFCGP